MVSTRDYGGIAVTTSADPRKACRRRWSLTTAALVLVLAIIAIVLAEWVLPVRWRSWLGDAVISPAMAGLLALSAATLALSGVRQTVMEAQRSSLDSARWARLEWALNLIRSRGSEGSLDRTMGHETLTALFNQSEINGETDVSRDRHIMTAARSVYHPDVLEPPLGVQP